MKAVIATDSISLLPLRGRHHPFTKKQGGSAQTDRPVSYVVICMFYPRNPNNIPAATALPITPATLGPMACISRKFLLS